jgi:hypothetical protein
LNIPNQNKLQKIDWAEKSYSDVRLLMDNIEKEMQIEKGGE